MSNARASVHFLGCKSWTLAEGYVRTSQKGLRFIWTISSWESSIWHIFMHTRPEWWAPLSVFFFFSISSGIILSASAHRQPCRPDGVNHKRPWTSANAAETHSWKWRKQANWIQKGSFTHLPQWARRQARDRASEPCCWHLQNHTPVSHPGAMLFYR